MVFKHSGKKKAKWLILLLILSSCSQAKQDSDLPLYTQKLISVAYGCECNIGGNPVIICKCKNEGWDKDIRIICKEYPYDLYSAYEYCFMVKLDKQK